jgi:uncharacterized protein
MGKFVISIRKNDEIQFSLKAENGETILVSEGYLTKKTCRKGIESVKKNAMMDNRYERKKSADGRIYFNLKARNGKVIGTSEMYNTAVAMEAGVNSVMTNAPDAATEDHTR